MRVKTEREYALCRDADWSSQRQFESLVRNVLVFGNEARPDRLNQDLALLSWAVSATEASVVSRRKVNVSSR
jgi:hypothetical protein